MMVDLDPSTVVPTPLGVGSNSTVVSTPLGVGSNEQSASGGQTFDVNQPGSNKRVGTAADATSEDVKRICALADKAQPAWEAKAPHQRAEVFFKAAELLATDRWRKQVVETLQSETACHVGWANVALTIAATTLRHAAAICLNIRGETFQSQVPGGRVVLERRAAGVVFSIAPWNARGCCIPLACGNSVVLKSSEYSPRSQHLWWQLMVEAGVPDGVVSIFHTSRENAAARTNEVIAHPAIKRITFTGSDRVARFIAVEAAKHLKQVTLELGGKNTIVVCASADLDAAAKAIVSASMLHGGQICMATDRVLAERSIADKLSDLIAKHAAGIDRNAVPPLFTEASAQRVVENIAEAKGKPGVQVLVGDGSHDGARVAPHVLRGVKSGMKLWHEETFGPVVTILEFDTADEAIALANDSEYGFVGAVWTSDLNAGHRIASGIKVGQVIINGSTIHTESGASLMGLSGTRSGFGRFDVEAFTDARAIVIMSQPAQSYPLVP